MSHSNSNTPKIDINNLNDLEINAKVIHQGGNSKVSIVKVQDKEYILKKYNTLQDLATRMDKEIAALKLLKEIKFDYAPRLICVNTEKRLALMTKLDGHKIRKLEDKHVKSIIQTMQELKRDNIKTTIPIKNASSSFIDMEKTKREVINDLSSEIRFAKDRNDKRLEEHLNCINAKLESKELHELISKIGKCKIDNQIFSFSDVGIHNCIEDDSSIYFFDFEHSGWDNPIKQLCDWILCPKNILECNFIQQLCDEFFREFPYHKKENLWMFMEMSNIRWQIISIRYRHKVSKKSRLTSDEIINLYNKNMEAINRLNIRG